MPHSDVSRDEHRARANELRRQIDQGIHSILNLFERFDPLELLARVSFSEQFGMAGQTFAQQGTGGRLESMVEYAQSLALSRPFPRACTRPDKETTQSFLKDVRNLVMKATLFHGSKLEAEESSPDQAELRGRIISDALLVRGQGYEMHIKQTFRDVAGKHDKFLKDRFGFTSSDFLGVMEQAETSINEEINRQMANGSTAWRALKEAAPAELRSRLEDPNLHRTSSHPFSAGSNPHFRNWSLNGIDAPTRWTTPHLLNYQRRIAAPLRFMSASRCHLARIAISWKNRLFGGAGLSPIK